MRVLLISDIHANLAALEAVFAACPSFDALWNLGDTIGYGPRPAQCLDLVRAHGAAPSLVGNHDLACIGEIDPAEFNPVAQEAARWTALQLSDDHREHLMNLPPMTGALGHTLAHGSPRDPIWEYVTTPEIATANFAAFGTNVCFVGHTHIAMSATLAEGAVLAGIRAWREGETLDLRSNRHIINPGSVGQPRDRDPRAAYAVLDTTRGTITAHRAAYDIATTQSQMRDARLPDFLISRLSVGI
jgi:diadenosine tetraphosphatase ApaH/serine/threonine PP2A family protein phosphatase